MSNLMSSNKSFKQGKGKVNHNYETCYIEKSKVCLFEKLFNEVVEKVGGTQKTIDKIKITNSIRCLFKEKRISIKHAKCIINAHNRIVKCKFT